MKKRASEFSNVGEIIKFIESSIKNQNLVVHSNCNSHF